MNRAVSKDHWKFPQFKNCIGCGDLTALNTDGKPECNNCYVKRMTATTKNTNCKTRSQCKSCKSFCVWVDPWTDYPYCAECLSFDIEKIEYSPYGGGLE